MALVCGAPGLYPRRPLAVGQPTEFMRIPHTQTIGMPVTQHVGSVRLRLTGLKPAAGVAHTKRSTPMETLSQGPSPQPVPTSVASKVTAPLHPVRVPSTVVELPWLMGTVAAAAQHIPHALTGPLLQGAALLSARLAPLILPTATLATILYPGQMGDSSLRFVPLNPRDHADVEGFDPLGPNDSVQQGVPHTVSTRQPTPRIRELPISATTEPQRHEGGPRVEVPSVPGRAQQVPNRAEGIHLATEKPADPAPHSHVNLEQPKKRN